VYACLLKLLHYFQVYKLLYRQIILVVAAFDEVYDVKLKTVFRHCFEENSVELSIISFLDDFCDDFFGFLDFLDRGFVADAYSELDSTFFYLAEVLNVRAYQCVVWNDEFFSLYACEAGCFDANRLDSSFLVVYADVISGFERFVEVNREGAENVAEDVL